MRRRDKLKNIERANLLAEQRYLESKGVLSEALTTDLKQFAEQTLKPKLEGAGFQVALFGADKLKMVADKVNENPKLIGIIWNPSNLKPYGSKNHISIHMNGEATAKVNSILSKFSFAKESGEAKQGKGWDSDTTHKALATYNEGDLVLIDGNNVRTKVIFQAGNPKELGLRTDLKEGQMYDGIEWESVGSGRDDMGYEHVVGTDNKGKFYEASAIINMRDEIETVRDIEEMSEDDYNELA